MDLFILFVYLFPRMLSSKKKNHIFVYVFLLQDLPDHMIIGYDCSFTIEIWLPDS